MLHRLLTGTAAVVAVLLPPAAAQAAAVTVHLRVEGPTATVFEGPVATDVRTFHFTGEPGTEHTCDGTASTGGTSPAPVPVRNAALLTAAEQHGFALTGAWSSFGASFDRVGDQAVGYDPSTGRYLAEFKNGQVSSLGGCSDPIADGDDVLYAYTDGHEPLLRLTGPAVAAPGRPVTVHVATSTGAAVEGATVGGSQTGPAGDATIAFAERGPRVLKASKPGTVRSNALPVCVTDGADGACGTTAGGESPPPPPPPPPCATTGDDGLCGTTAGGGSQATPPPPPCATTGDDGLCGTLDRRPPWGKITSIREGQRFAHRRGPRRLAGIVKPEPSGIAAIRLRLTRRVGGRCQTYDGRAERLVRLRACGARHGRWFAIGTRDAGWSYLLPARLGRGRWVLDLRVSDGAGNVDRLLQRTRTRVVFGVR